MNLGRISVKRIFLLVSGGMAVSMLAICEVFFAVTGQMWILASGVLLTLCALIWMFLLSIAFSKRLSVFTRELCQAMDQMISGSGEPMRAADSETLFARISYRLSRLYGIMQQGVGIGLYLTREIVMRQGGYIKVVSEPGKGSEFSIMLPVR